MNRDDIIRMAQEAKLLGEFDTAEYIFENGVEVWISGQRGLDALEKFAALVASAEREACVKACDDVITNEWEGAVDCANAIRARGQA